MSKTNSFVNDTPKGPSYTKTQTWLTPEWIIDGLGGFASFDLDPCGHLLNNKPIVETALSYFTEKEDGLKQQWRGNVFCNPPYNTRDDWLEKMAAHGRGIVLIFVRSETKSFQKYVKTATGINLMAKRVTFLNHEGKSRFLNEKGKMVSGSANAPSCLIAWGEDNYQRIKNIPGIYLRIDKQT